MTFQLTLEPGQLCGNEVIDSQHERLADIVNRFFRCFSRACCLEVAKVTCGALLEELIEEAEEHFSAEDCSMIRTGYPRTDEHRRAHAELLQEVIELFIDLRDDRRKVDREFFDQLECWLVEHIVEEDIPLGAYLATWAAEHPGEQIPYSVAELGEEPPPIPPDHPAAGEPA